MNGKRNISSERESKLYDVYCRTKDPDARLFLVGSISEVPEYYTYLEEYRKKLGYKENQIILTGHEPLTR